MFQTLADRQLGSCKLRVFQQEGDFVFVRVVLTTVRVVLTTVRVVSTVVRVVRIASQKQEPQGTRSELML